MKVRTSLFLLSAVFVILIAALGYVMFRASNLINMEVRDSESANQIIKDISELNFITYEYLSHHEARMDQQWLQKYDSLGKLLEGLRKEEIHPEHLSRLEAITLDYESLGDFFSLLQANFTERGRLIEENKPQAEIDLSFSSEKRLSSQALIRSQRMASEAFKFSALMEERIAQVQQRTNAIALLSTIGFIVLSFSMSFFTSRAIIGPLNELIKSAEIIGTGDLKHRVDIETRNEIGELAVAFNQMTGKRQQAEEELTQRTHDLGERVKELNCLHAIHDIASEVGPSLKDILKRTVNILPGGWQYPEVTCARIMVEDNEYTTDNFEETQWNQTSEIIVQGNRIGAVEVGYLQEKHQEDRGVFLKEEYALLDTISKQLGRTVERVMAEDELKIHSEHLEEMVEERTAELEATNKELESFSYSVSHDLRAPLRAMDGFSQVILEDYTESVDETGRDYLNRIRRASQLMGTLIDGLLNLSHVARTNLHREKVDLSELAKNIVRDLQQSDPQRRVEFAIDETPDAEGDEALLRVVMQNLLDNSWKFTKDRSLARIEFRASTRGGELVYFVRDNGVGFDKAYADQLFAPFQRLHAVDEFPGTGIGLATVKRIIHRHRGRVWAEAESDEGATFYFTIH